MNFQSFIGVDVSKLTLDVFIRENQKHKQFKNQPKHFPSLLQWILKNTQLSSNDLCFCFEHTGMYSLALALFLEEYKIHYAMIAPLEIKRSMGITRGKNDYIDAKRIAEYAYRFNDKIKLTKLPSKDIMRLHSLLNLRDRLVRNRSGYIVSESETALFMDKQCFDELFTVYRQMIDTLSRQIKKVENTIKAILKSNEQLWSSFELATSVKGIGPIVAAYLIVYTHNFSRFKNWRKFSCYSGIAPFEYQSGTSVRGRTKVSSIANQQIKKLLHLSALCAIHTDKEIQQYYQRRQKEGKSKMTIINIVRNKLIARVFATIKRGTPFVEITNYRT